MAFNRYDGVVIAIVAILAALLLPAMKKGIAMARQTQSISNLKMMGSAATLYSADHNGALIVAKSGPQDVPARTQWQNLLAPYVRQSYELNGGSGIWDLVDMNGARCKEFGVFWLPTLFPESISPKGNIWDTGYGMNMQPGLPEDTRANTREADPPEPNSSGEFQVVNITHKAQRILIGEWPAWNMWAAQAWDGGLPKIQNCAKAQGGALRALFFDGHVEALTPQAYLDAVDIK